MLEEMHNFCLVCLLWHFNAEHTASLRSSQQLFVFYGEGACGQDTKQTARTLAMWTLNTGARAFCQKNGNYRDSVQCNRDSRHLRGSILVLLCNLLSVEIEWGSIISCGTGDIKRIFLAKLTLICCNYLVGRKYGGLSLVGHWVTLGPCWFLCIFRHLWYIRFSHCDSSCKITGPHSLWMQSGAP